MLDAVCVGEADYSVADVCDGLPLAEIPGLYYREGEEVLSTGWRTPIANLDELPLRLGAFRLGGIYQSGLAPLGQEAAGNHGRVFARLRFQV